MSYEPYNWPGFGAGLNLRKVSDGSGQSAIDCMNVTFTAEGGVRSRHGYTQFAAGSSGTSYGQIAGYQRSRGTAMRHVLASQGTAVRAYNNDGTLLASYTAGTNADWQFCRWGSPAGEYLVATNGVDSPIFWDGPTGGGGSGFQAITAMAGYTAPTAPLGKHIAAFQNRLAVARLPGSAAGNCESTVRFSSNGNPWEWLSSYYADIRPGDGDEITALESYADQLFVFKRNSVHVIYNVGATSTGSAQIDQRLIVQGVGAVGPNAVTTGPGGVYFVHDTGVYVTRGGEPELISAPIDPIFKGNPPLEWKGGVLTAAYVHKIAAQWHDNELRISIPVDGSSANTRTLSHHTDYGWWTISNLKYRAIGTAPVGQAGRLQLVAALDDSTNPKLVLESKTATTDAGVLIASRWRSDSTDFGLSRRKTIGGMRAWGEGKVFSAVGTDYTNPKLPRLLDFDSSADTWGSGGADTWGGGTNAADEWSGGNNIQMRYVRAAHRGTNITLQLRDAGSTSGWAVYKAVLHMRAVTPTGTETRDE